jgi:hypothetical protein
MKKIDIWQDPIFGYVPEKYRDWYLRTSGTEWKDGFSRWYVDGNNIISRSTSKAGKAIIQYRANVFQDAMGQARRLIIEAMGTKTKNYVIGHKDIFELMMNKKLQYEYSVDGQNYIEVIIWK